MKNQVSTDLSLEQKSSVMRRATLTAIFHAGSGHPGGCLSCIDLLTSVFHEKAERKDSLRFIMSKGHAAPALYAAGGVFGYCPLRDVMQLRKMGSPFQGHPHVGLVPWVETSTGSLGQGFSVAVGMALGARFQNSGTSVVALLGDGELQEGEVWEAAMSAAHFKLSNLVAIIDYNKLQSDDLNANIMGVEPLDQKWSSFGWQVLEIDGHDFTEIAGALKTALSNECQPTVIIAHTIKGKGVSFMENVPSWHGSVKMEPDELTGALGELGVSKEEIPNYLSGSVWDESL